MNMTEERRLNWARVWCNKTHTTCPLISLEDEFDSDDFELCEQLIQDQIILEAQANFEKVSGKKLTSTPFGSSSSSSSRSSSPSSFVLPEDNIEIDADVILDAALTDLN
jgi:hypothetical protein